MKRYFNMLEQNKYFLKLKIKQSILVILYTIGISLFTYWIKEMPLSILFVLIVVVLTVMGAWKVTK